MSEKWQRKYSDKKRHFYKVGSFIPCVMKKPVEQYYL